MGAPLTPFGRAALAALAACALGAAADAGAAAAARCDASWRVVPRLDAPRRAFDVELTFDAKARTSTVLLVTREWGGVTDFAKAFGGWRTGAAHQRVEPGGDPASVRVVHRPGERVVVRYRVAVTVADPGDTPFPDHRDSYRPLAGGDWFQFFGHAVLAAPSPLAEGAAPANLCVAIDRAPPGTIATSHGTARGTAWRATVTGRPDRVLQAVYVGGRIGVAERTLPGGRLVVARRGEWSTPLEALADATARVVAGHRDFWNDHAFPYFLVTLVPNGHPSGSYGGTAVEQAFAMNAAADFRVPGPVFDFLVGHEHLHTWIPWRVGSLGDEATEAQHYWFSEGFTDYYAHRLLVRAGLWSLDRYADALNAKIARYLASPERTAPNARIRDAHAESADLTDLPYQRGELLALRLDAMLRERGTDLDAVMRSLVLARADAERLEREGRSHPDALATARLSAALLPRLGDALRDVERSIVEGDLVAFPGDLLGPCFDVSAEVRPRWTLGFAPRSFRAGVAEGVDPAGPAYAAGLRDGDRLESYSVRRDDVATPVRLTIRDAGGAVREVSYLPAAPGSEVPVYRTDARRQATEACRRWVRGAASPPAGSAA